MTFFRFAPRVFQHTAARRRLGTRIYPPPSEIEFQHTAARRRLAQTLRRCRSAAWVSTHSRPKAAGTKGKTYGIGSRVSTHSRPKAAGFMCIVFYTVNPVFQHTAARRRLDRLCRLESATKSFNTQPPEGGWERYEKYVIDYDGFNTQPPEGGWSAMMVFRTVNSMFQHTAARRRLGFIPDTLAFWHGFNTQPPEGGWQRCVYTVCRRQCFNTQPPEGGWPSPSNEWTEVSTFQHTAARRRLAKA